MNQEVVLPST